MLLKRNIFTRREYMYDGMQLPQSGFRASILRPSLSNICACCASLSRHALLINYSNFKPRKAVLLILALTYSTAFAIRLSTIFRHVSKRSYSGGRLQYLKSIHSFLQKITNINYFVSSVTSERANRFGYLFSLYFIS